jgi:glycosyltransferase involved in cell wall biosynthesis
MKNKLTIGLPIYNEENNIVNLIKCLKNQTYQKFDIIISENASTDGTKKKLKKLLKKNKRIKIYNQKKNIGSHKNFQFVLNKAKTKYFMWLAADDIISVNFIKNNLNFLEKNKDYIGSTSKNIYDWDRKFSIYKDKRYVDFKLDQDLDSNIINFLKNIDYSHAVFFSIFKKKVLEKCSVVKQNFFAGDWAIMLFMIGNGKINRDLKSNIIFGTSGISYKKNSYTQITNAKTPKFPLLKFSLYLLKFIFLKNMKFRSKIYMLFWILKKNFLYFNKKL